LFEKKRLKIDSGLGKDACDFPKVGEDEKLFRKFSPRI